MYRFLASSKWVGYAALSIVLAAIMVCLGLWQLSRYHERAAANARISAAQKAVPVPVQTVLAVGRPPSAAVAWTRVSAQGRYDAAHQILARDRTVNGAVGFEVLVPLVLADGSSLLVDRGWLPVPGGDAGSVPKVPATPDGEVGITGRVHLPESSASAAHATGGRLEIRRISPARLAAQVPYPLYGGYVVLDSQQPQPNDPAFVAIPADYQNAAMNAGYVVQWCAFALITLVGFGWVARRQAHPAQEIDWAALAEEDLPDAPVSPAV